MGSGKRDGKRASFNGTAAGNCGGDMEMACPQAVRYSCESSWSNIGIYPTLLRSVTIQLFSLQPARISVRKLLACPQSHVILRGVWERSPERDGWWVGHY